MRALAFLMLAAAAPAAQAQQAPTTDATAPDPARFTAARALMAQIMPPGQVEKTLDSVMQAVFASTRQTFLQNPAIAEMQARDPATAQILERALDRQRQLSVETVKAGMPGMIEAMARAYARRFTAQQLDELAAFFATPTGKTYVEQAPLVMTDPDVLGWMNGLMRQQMARASSEAARIAAEMAARKDSK